MCYVFNEFAYTERKKNMKLPSPEPYFYFIFFFHYCRAHRRRQQNISFSLSNDHYKKKKIERIHLSHPRTLQENGHFYFIIIMYIFFYSTHAGDDCYNSNAPFAFLQPVRVRPRALLSFGRHFATGRTLYIILIYYIFAKRERRKTLSLELVGAAFIRGSCCRLYITLYYFIRANPIKLFRFEILKVSRLAINIVTHRCTRHKYNILHTDNIYMCMYNIIELSSPLLRTHIYECVRMTR